MTNNPHTMFLLFNHSLTTEQEKDAQTNLGIHRFVELENGLKDIWVNIPPELPDIRNHLEPIKKWLASEAAKGDLVLIQGDFGACRIMVGHAFDLGLVPIYSTTERKAEETRRSDGSVILTHCFYHRIFRYYTR